MEDMKRVARAVLGPQIDPDTGRANWGVKEDGISASGYAVITSDEKHCFIYGTHNVESRARGPDGKLVYGLKRVIFGKNGRKKAVSTGIILTAGDEFEERTSYPDK